MSAGWGLAIDYGTSFTAAAVMSSDGVEVLEVEDSRRFPSSVLLSEDESLLVGRGALNQARRSPDRFERSPKRLLGQPAALLGSRPVEVVEMVAAVLERVGDAARTRQGQAAPDWVRMTNPAGWGQERQDVLRAAARRARLGEIELLTEPEAAAWFFVQDRRGEEPVAERGQCVAVYDLGGGTFDTAILRRSDEGFQLAGPPGGLDWFGGEDFDQRLYDWVLGRVYELDVDAWRHLKEPDSAGWRRARLQLREDVRQAKEALSTMAHVSVPVSKSDEVLDVEVTRTEFEGLIEADLRRTVDILEKTARDANVTSEEIAAVYLTGGSSRVPLAAALASQFHPHTYTRPDPKTLVAHGALAKPGPQVQERPTAVADAPAQPPGPPPETPPPAEPPPEPEPPRPLCKRGPRVSGKPVVGRRLSVDPGKWAPGTDLSIQWLRRGSESDDWATVGSANRETYELTEADLDGAVAVRVSGTDGDRKEEIESNVIRRVRPARPPRRQRVAKAPPRPKPKSGPKPKSRPKPTPRPEPKPAAQAPPRKPTREGKRLSPVLLAAGLVVIGVLAPAGFLVGRGGDDDAAPAGTRAESAGPLGLRVPGGWKAGARGLSVPGLELSDEISFAPPGAGSGTGMVAGVGRADSPALLSRRLERELGAKAEEPRAVKMGELEAYRYGPLALGDGAGRLTLYVTPASAGVGTVGCLSRSAAPPDFGEECDAVAASAKLVSGEPFKLGRDAGYERKLDRTFNSLDAALKPRSAQLDRARTPARQAAAAQTISRAHRSSARSLTGATKNPGYVTANRRIKAELLQTSGAYGSLAAAARAGDRSRYASAREAVRSAQRRLRRSLDALESQ